MNWVKEDQNRLKQPPLLPQMFPVVPTTSFNSEDIETMLKQLSKCEGWKFNPNSGKAVLECANQQQADRVLQTLLATKAVGGLVSKSLVERNPIVLCVHYDFIKLQDLASPFQLDVTEEIDIAFWCSIE